MLIFLLKIMTLLFVDVTIGSATVFKEKYIYLQSILKHYPILIPCNLLILFIRKQLIFHHATGLQVSPAYLIVLNGLALNIPEHLKPINPDVIYSDCSAMMALNYCLLKTLYLLLLNCL